MGLKILHSADWHMGAPFSSFSEDRRAALKREQLALPGKIAAVCRQENCDLMLLAGDLFDGKPGQEALEAVKQALADCGIPVFVSPGNHDHCQPGSVWLEESWPENVCIFTGDMASVGIPALDCRIYGAGYRSMDCGPLLENFHAEGPETHQLAVLHGDPITMRSPYCPITSAQVRASGLRYLALGHIHKAGMFRAGETVCAWPGCPMGRGWDETGEKGLCITTIEGDGVQVRLVPLDVPRFFELEADITEGGEAVLDALLPAGESRDFFRITLTGQTDEDVEELRQRYDRFPNLFLRDETRAKKDLWEDADSDSLRGVYFRLLRQRAQEDSRAVLAAEISQRILSGREVRLP